MGEAWPAELENFLGMYETMIRTMRPDEAMRILAIQLDAHQLDLIRQEHLARAVRTLALQSALDGRPGRDAWYVPDAEGVHWGPVRRHYESKPGWEAEDVATLDHSSDSILARLDAPYEDEFRTRGLVLGYIQSGKTANYSAVIAKAADQGFRLFVVLSGTTENLRRQTEERLRAELYEMNPELWHTLTGVQSDFALNPRVDNPASRLSDDRRRCLAVVKKNTAPLRKLRSWLAAAGETLHGVPLLIIDDEADNAGLNTGTSEDRTAVNRAILDLLATAPKAAYVAYTATPFANFFVDAGDPSDLYPRDFIVSLPKPNRHYFGTERLFGRSVLDEGENEDLLAGMDVIRTVPQGEVTRINPTARGGGEPELVPTLAEAIDYFMLASAVRRTRGLTDEHSTMLVHTSHLNRLHASLSRTVGAQVARLRQSIADADPDTVDRLRSLWERESRRVPSSDFGLEPVEWDSALAVLGGVINSCQVVVDDCSSLGGLEYEQGAPGVYIVIGGNVLSRGLTLRGLVVSYFTRLARTYDALLQMGRWFGYRLRYEDLPRIWTTSDLEDKFFFLATVEEEIRRDIAQYEEQGLSPAEAAVRVRLHPGMAITSKAKMRDTVTTTSTYSERRLQTIRFYTNDEDWLEANILATTRLVSAARDAGAECKELSSVLDSSGKGKWLLTSVPHQAILVFAAAYRLYERSELQPEALDEYIRREVEHGALGLWDVAVMGREALNPRLSSVNLGLPSEVNLINRSRYGHLDPAVLKAIRSPGDIDLVRRGLRELLGESYANSNPDEGSRGLLLLYPIASNSAPALADQDGSEDDQSTLRPLGAVRHVVGLSYVFPRAKVPGGVRFRVNPLNSN